MNTRQTAPIAATEFRGFMRLLPAGVGVVTTGAHGYRRGLTATAICSLSDDPPTILVCVNQRAAAHNFIIDHGAFAVNILRADQTDLAKCFSGQTGVSGEARFGTGIWITLQTGAPALETALFTLDCELTEHMTFSTHTIFIGRVVAAAGSPSEPLVYHDGSYKVLAARR